MWVGQQNSLAKPPTSILHSFNRPVETIICCLQMDTSYGKTQICTQWGCASGQFPSFCSFCALHFTSMLLLVHDKRCLKIDFGFVLIIEYIWLLINIFCVQPGNYMKIGKWGDFKYSMIKFENCPKDFVWLHIENFIKDCFGLIRVCVALFKCAGVRSM